MASNSPDWRQGFQVQPDWCVWDTWCYMCPRAHGKASDRFQSGSGCLTLHFIKSKPQLRSCKVCPDPPERMLAHVRVHSSHVSACQHMLGMGHKEWLIQAYAGACQLVYTWNQRSKRSSHSKSFISLEAHNFKSWITSKVTHTTIWSVQTSYLHLLLFRFGRWSRSILYASVGNAYLHWPAHFSPVSLSSCCCGKQCSLELLGVQEKA